MARIKQVVCSNCVTDGCTVVIYIGQLVHCPRKTVKPRAKQQISTDKTPDSIKAK